MSKEIETRVGVHEILIEQHGKSISLLGERCSGMEKFRIIVYAYFGALGTIIALAIGFTKLFETLG